MPPNAELTEEELKAAHRLCSERPSIGAPEDGRAVREALYFADKRPEFSFIKFWRACGMPS